MKLSLFPKLVWWNLFKQLDSICQGGLPRGVKWCQSEGVKVKLPPNSYIVLPPLADQKRCKSGGLICPLPPHSYTILPPLEAQCSPKRRKSFELHFPKKSSHCSPTLTSFWAEKFNPGGISVLVGLGYRKCQKNCSFIVCQKY